MRLHVASASFGSHSLTLVLFCIPFLASLSQDYRVHIKHSDGRYETIPYFSLPSNDLNDVIAPSCLSCMDYPSYLSGEPFMSEQVYGLSFPPCLLTCSLVQLT
jgi:hypothetical protein